MRIRDWSSDVCSSDLEEEQWFNERWSYIKDHSLEDILKKLEQSKMQKNELSSEDNLFFLELLGFLDSLLLFHIPYQYSPVFNAYLNQTQIERVSSLASCDKIRALGGLKCVYSEPLSTTLQELADYFTQLEQLLNSMPPQKTGFILDTLTPHMHAIPLMYKPKQGWFIQNINGEAIEAYRASNTTDLACEIFKAFSVSHNSSLALNNVLLTTGHDLRNEHFQRELAIFKDSHIITRKIAARLPPG